MAKTRGAHAVSPSACNPRPRASPTRDSTSEAPQAFAIPPSEGGVPSSPPHRRYEMRRPPTTPGASTLCPKKSVRRAPTKKARVSSPRESSAPPQPQPPTTESQIPSGMTPEVIIKRPMVEIPIDIIPPAPVAPSTVPTPEATSFAPSTMPEAPPVVPATSAPPPSESSITISSSEFRGLCHTLQTLSTTQTKQAIPSQEATLVEQTMPHEETTIVVVETPIQSTQETTAEPSSPHDPPTTT
ncbi:hypothetical protein AAG906_025117 [Vitis piasezkii]